MTIELKDIPVNIKRVILEFDDLGEVANLSLDENTKNIKVSKQIKKQETKLESKKELNNGQEEQLLDLNFGSAQSQQISKEPIEKPIIEDKKRETKISSNMQNLKI